MLVVGWHSIRMSTHPLTLIANWKMHGRAAEVRQYAHAVNAALWDAPPALSAVFCPPALYVAEARSALPHNARLGLGAQYCHAEAKGAFTGEISAAMLADCGARYVILGHSERRAMGEGDAAIRAQAEAALAAGLSPVLCVGESRAAYEAGETLAVLAKQVNYFQGLTLDRCRIAYEPIWAIGSSQTPKMTEITAAHQAIKSVLGSGVSVLYGGSVNPGNAEEILRLNDVGGALIGGASLTVESMCALLELAKRVVK